MLEDAPTLALLDPTPVPMIVSGVASKSNTLDCDRVRTARRAFGALPAPNTIPLRLDHDEAKGVVGSIETLEYDADGSLLITARVTDERAVRRPAFSIAASIDDYEINERELSATVLRARLMEVSLVINPCDRHARVLSRQRPVPSVEFYRLIGQKVAVLIRMADAIKEMQSCPSR